MPVRPHLALTLAAALAASPAAATPPDSVAGIWHVQRLFPQDQLHGVAIMITFTADGHVSGHGGCNRFAGSFTQTRDQLAFGTIAATKMACPAPQMTAEAAFFLALSQVTHADLHEGILTLSGREGPLMAARR